MPVLTFKDGKKLEVEYGVAAKILQTQKNPTAANDEQRIFAQKVTHISFGDLPSLRSDNPAAVSVEGHDDQMDKILQSGLKGRDLARAVVERIKVRRRAAALKQQPLL